MSLIKLGPYIIPTPPGLDPSDAESLARYIPLLKAKHFIFPWLAHAMGTLAGAFIVYKLAAIHNARLAYAIGVLNLIGGITMVVIIPNSPIAFIILDLGLAYIPMAWLGIWLVSK